MDKDFCIPWENPNITKEIDINKPKDASKSIRHLFKYWPSNNNLIDFSIPHFISVYPATNCEFPVIENKDLHAEQCQNCGAYIDYLAKIKKETKEWTCPYCLNNNKIDDEIYAHFIRRHELYNSYYEIKLNSNQKFNKNLLFIIDISYPSIVNGMTDETIKQIRYIITTTPPNYNIAIMTMSDKLTLYKLHTSEKVEIDDFQLKMVPFNNIFQPVATCMDRLDKIFDEITEFVPDDSLNGHCLYNAILQAGNIMQDNGGMILASFCGLSKFGPYARTVTHDLEIDQSAQMAQDDPTTKKSIEIGLVFKSMNVSIHLFACGPVPCDLIAAGHMATATNGRVYYYGKMTEDSKRSFHNDIVRTINSHYFFNCSLNINISKGLRFVQKEEPTSFPEIFKKDVRFPIMRENDFCSIGIKNIFEVKNCYIQISMVYSKFHSGENEENENNENENNNNNSTRVEKFLRVITHVIPVTDDKEKLYRSIDEASLIKMITDCFLTNAMRFGVNDIVPYVMNEMMHLHPNYPKSLFHLTHSLFSNSIFLKGPKSESNKKSAGIIKMFFFDEITMLLFLYPRLILVEPAFSPTNFFSLFKKFSLFKLGHNYEEDQNEQELINNLNNDLTFVNDNVEKSNKFSLYKTLPLSKCSLDKGTVFVIHSFDKVIVLVRKNVNKIYLEKAFGVKNLSELKKEVPLIDSPENKKIWSIYGECCKLSKSALPLETLIEDGCSEFLNDLFVDDKLVSFASLPTWISQFFFQASLVSCI